MDVALQFQPISIPFAGGIDSKTDPKRVLPGKLLALQNGVFTKGKKITKRYGYDALSTTIQGVYGATITSSQSMGFFENEMLLFSSNYLYSWSPSTNTWAQKTQCYSVRNSNQTVVRNQGVQSVPDLAICQGIQVFVYEDTSKGGVCMTVIDSATGAVHQNNVQLDASGVTPKAIAIGNQIFVWYITGTNLALRIFNPQTPSLIGNATNVFTDVHGTYKFFDVGALSQNMIVAYCSSANTNEIKVAYVLPTGTVGSVSNGYPNTAVISQTCTNCLGLAIYPTTGLIAVFYGNSSSLSTTGNTTNGQPTVTNLASTAGLSINDPVSGTNIQVGSRIIAISGTTITLNNNATGTTTGGSLTITTGGLMYTALNFDFSVAQASVMLDSDTTTPAIRVAPYFLTPAQVAAQGLSGIQLGAYWEKATSSGNAYDHIVIGGGSFSVIWPYNSFFGVGTLMRSVGLASKAFVVGTDTLVCVVHDSTLQGTFFVINSNGIVVSKMMPGQAGGLPAKQVLPSVTVDSSNNVYFPAQIKTKFVSNGNTTFFLKGISLETIAFSPSSPYISREISQNLLIAGGYVQAYDGSNPVELGFHFFPENITATPSTTGGSMAAGTYAYYVVYAWQDRWGQMHRSTPSVAIQAVIASGSTGSVAFSLPTLRVTAKSGVMIEVYRTTASGTTAYLVTSFSSPTMNSTTSDTVAFTDTNADSSITANTILYTTGNVLGNDAPPSAYLLDVNKNRCVIAGLEDPLSWGYSQQSQQGSGIAFSSYFISRMDPLGGPITAVKFMDDKIVFFKNSYIFFVSGDGPDNTGNNNTFTQPILVTTDVGCVNPKSCVLTPQGLMFQTAKGIYLLERSLQVSYIGADVEAYNSQTITAATLIEDKNQVRFLVSSGVTLVYDYYFGQWSTFTNHTGTDAGLWKGTTYVYARSNGQVYQEDSSTYLDASLPFALVIQTAWIKLNSLQGFQRVKKGWFLGDYLSEHQLRVQVAYDYNDYFSEQHLFNATNLLGSEYYGQSGTTYGSESPYGGVSTSAYQFRLNLAQHRCQAIQFQFDDIQNPITGPSYSISDLQLEVGLKKGGMRLPAAQQV